MSRKLMSLVALLIALYLLLCGALFVFQRSLIYFPQPDSAVATTDSRLKLTMPDADVWVATRAHVGPKALIYFGGNAEDVSRNLPSFSEAFTDYALFLLNYRGFGGSGGSPSEEAIAEDALALFDQVYASHPQIAVIGRSLGSGVAVRLASQRPAKQLILVTPYNSLEDIAVRQYPWMPVKWLLKDRFESGRYAAHIRVPTLLLAASDDEVIPRDSTQRLLQSFPKGVATLRVVPDAGHNSISERAQYLQWMEDVLDR
ncbi:alpha/beta hydrolase [Pseudomonas sp. 13B_3.2_Bac1]|uniref:alpha/beta hydrolase n=1 Tax=Pseudomonas sp. 13B_3.2_Bac1 TaxID=2971623 RepID=UPI0021C8E095|nr:lysophospholipase [Pseudomonas sp. 13B_3.2_Bac1]MCU1770932.1 lysophospholipase [Pseudomonas sp. 13B_3.2_Bac1]